MLSQANSLVEVSTNAANQEVKMQVIPGSKKTFFDKISLIMPSYLIQDSVNENDRRFKYWLKKPYNTEKHDLMIYIKSSLMCVELTKTDGSKLLVNCKDNVTVELVSNNQVTLHSNKETEFFTCWRNTTGSKQTCKTINSKELNLFFKDK